jgi:hypothetical protein
LTSTTIGTVLSAAGRSASGSGGPGGQEAQRTSQWRLGIGQLALGGHNQGFRLRQEGGRDADRTRQQAARVVAQVEHQTLDIRVLGIQGLGFHAQFVEGIFLELAHAQPCVTGLDHLGLDALDHDLLAQHRQHPGLVFAAAGNGERDLAAGLATHALDRLVKRHIAHRDVIDTRDQVARLDAGLVRRGVFDRRHHLDVAVFAGHFDPHADEPALHRFLHFTEGFLVEVAGMGVERGDHAADGFGQEFLVLDRFDIIGLDQAIDIGQLAQFVERQRRAQVVLGVGRKLERNGHAGHHAKADQPETLRFIAHALAHVCP